MTGSAFVTRLVARGAGLAAPVRPPVPPEAAPATSDLAVEEVETVAAPQRATAAAPVVPAAEERPGPQPAPAPSPIVAAAPPAPPPAPVAPVTPARVTSEVRRSPEPAPTAPAPPPAPAQAGPAPRPATPAAEPSAAPTPADAVVEAAPPAPHGEAPREPAPETPTAPPVASVPPEPALERTVVVAAPAERAEPAAPSEPPELVETTVLVPTDQPSEKDQTAVPVLREARPPAPPPLRAPTPRSAPIAAQATRPDPESRLEIGTIEIVVDPPPAPVPAAPAQVASPPSGFDDYLATRSYTR